MKHHEIEAWVLSIVDRVIENDAHIEDSRVELKREFPDSQTAARQIAGHANAARGAPILWIIGIDEKARTITGANMEELANWLPSVKSCFDSIMPSLVDLNVTTNNKTLVCLLFETYQIPFVVKNPMNGKVGGGSVEWEIPWREGRQTRSARREHLIRLLAPLVYAPTIECLIFTLSFGHPVDSSKKELRLHGSLFISPANETRIVFPFYKIRIKISQNKAIGKNWRNPRLTPPMIPVSSGNSLKYVPDSFTAQASEREVIVSGPSTLHLESTSVFENMDEELPIILDISFFIAGNPAPTLVSAILQRQREGGAQWVYKNPEVYLE